MTTPLKPTLQIGHYAFVDEGDITVLYNMDTRQPILVLTGVGEYALARMLVEKINYFDDNTRKTGESIYEKEVSVEGRILNLS